MLVSVTVAAVAGRDFAVSKLRKFGKSVAAAAEVVEREQAEDLNDVVAAVVICDCVSHDGGAVDCTGGNVSAAEVLEVVVVALSAFRQILLSPTCTGASWP